MAEPDPDPPEEPGGPPCTCEHVFAYMRGNARRATIHLYNTREVSFNHDRLHGDWEEWTDQRDGLKRIRISFNCDPASAVLTTKQFCQIPMTNSYRHWDANPKWVVILIPIEFSDVADTTGTLNHDLSR